MATGTVTVETLQRLVDVFNTHDLDAVMGFFTDDCVLELPRGPDPWGRRFQGRDECARGWQADSPASPTSTTARTATGSAAKGAARSGC
jgi:ketosteroid isomerase-like protein